MTDNNFFVVDWVVDRPTDLARVVADQGRGWELLVGEGPAHVHFPRGNRKEDARAQVLSAYEASADER